MDDPGTGVVIGPPRTPRGVPRGVPPAFSFQGAQIQPMLDALMSRYGKAMDISLAEMERMPARNEQAFAQWLAGKRQQQDVVDYGMESDIDRREQEQIDRMAAARAERERAAWAREEERKRVLATVGRNTALQSRYGGAYGFTPEGSVAEYYEYGGGR